jgi:hypothetical protein
MTFKLQQDNAKPHRIHNDPELLQHMSTMTVKVDLFDQPPNSPDLNVLDLGYFAAIQALQQRQQQRTVDDLVAAVDKSLKNCHLKFGKIFVTFQKVMELVILHDGCNQFKLPGSTKWHGTRHSTSVGRTGGEAGGNWKPNCNGTSSCTCCTWSSRCCIVTSLVQKYN